MDEVRAMNKIEANLSKEKIDFINDAHKKESQYWKKIALKNRSKDETKQVTDLSPSRVFLAGKDAAKNKKNFNEIDFYLKIQYLPHNDERRTIIEDIPNEEDQFPFEEKSDYLRTFSKSMKEVENMSLKNKVSLGGWISTAVKVFRRDKNMRRENLPG